MPTCVPLSSRAVPCGRGVRGRGHGKKRAVVSGRPEELRGARRTARTVVRCGTGAGHETALRTCTHLLARGLAARALTSRLLGACHGSGGRERSGTGAGHSNEQRERAPDLRQAPVGESNIRRKIERSPIESRIERGAGSAQPDRMNAARSDPVTLAEKRDRKSLAVGSPNRMGPGSVLR